MKYQLDLMEIRDSFNFDAGKTISHNPARRTRLLPYTTTTFNKEKHNFKAVIGEFIRLVGRKKLSQPIDVDSILEKVLDVIKFDEISHRSECKQLIRSLFLNDNQELHLFHSQVLFYIEAPDLENKKMAMFLFQVLWGNNNILEDDLIQLKPQDVMTTLLFNALPGLHGSTDIPQKYDMYFEPISQLFIADFKWLINKPQLFVTHFEKLLSYYYFFYVSQFSLLCEAMFHADRQHLTPIFFNLDWENFSQSRTSYERGWKCLEQPISRLFSHINCLEFLNHKVNHSEIVFTYQRIGELIREMTFEQQTELEIQLDQLIEEYKIKLEAESKWGLLVNVNSPYENKVLNKIYLFYRMIDHQFIHSKRNKPYQEYQKRFYNFCQTTFLKSRGRSGKSLKLDADNLLFLTKLILKDDEKIRLKLLFDEFELRGIAFDRDTQTAIVEYFEAINILEKKSDSGDAIYVKAFL